MPAIPDDPRYQQQGAQIVPDAAPMQAQPAAIVPDMLPTEIVAAQPAGIVPDASQKPGISVGQGIGGTAEMLLTMGTSLYAEPLAGVAGLATMALTNNPEASADVVEGVRNEFMWLPKSEGGQRVAQFLGDTVGKALGYVEQNTGNVVFDATGSPAAAAWASAIPAGFAEVLGVVSMKNAAKSARNVKQRRIGEAELKGRDYQNAARQLELEAERIASPENHAQAVDAFKTLDPNEIAQSIQADPNFYRAADELGINTEPLAAYAAQNSQARDVLGSLQAMPGSALDAQARAFITETGHQARNIIEEYGGTTDKAKLTTDFYDNSMRTVDDLFKQEDVLYTDIRTQMDPAQKVIPSETLRTIRGFEREFGGVEKLPPGIRKLKSQLEVKEQTKTSGSGMMGTRKARTKTTEAPTYYKLDDERRLVGQAIEKQDGPFKDVDVARLKRLYGSMRDDIDAVADAKGFGEQLKQANHITQNRKIIEDNLKTLLTRNLNRDISTVVGQSVKGIKGQTGRFKQVVKAIDEINNIDRTLNAGKNNIMDSKEIVLSAMNDAMRGTGAEQGLFNANQYTKFMNELNQQPALKKLLYDNIPRESHKALENLHKVARGIKQANEFVIRTGRTQTLLDETGVLHGLMAGAAKRGANIVPGGGAEILKNFIDQKGSVAKPAAELMASPQFQEMLRTTIMEGTRRGVFEGTKASKKLKQAEKALLKSQKYQEWVNAAQQRGGLSDEALMLMSTAPVTYFISQSQAQAEPAQSQGMRPPQ